MGEVRSLHFPRLKDQVTSATRTDVANLLGTANSLVGIDEAIRFLIQGYEQCWDPLP